MPAGTTNEYVVKTELVGPSYTICPEDTGVTLLLAALAGPVPAALEAVTVKVYAVPVVSPATVIGEDDPVAVIPPGLEVTV